jgi:hypothetical protein
MRIFRYRPAMLLLTAGAMLPASGCDIAGAILQTIGLAFNIVDVWV